MPQGMAAKGVYDTLAIAVEADRKYSVIVNATCTLVTPSAQKFISSILVGHSLAEGIEVPVRDIKVTYHGAAQNALIAALKDLYRTYTSNPGLADLRIT